MVRVRDATKRTTPWGKLLVAAVVFLAVGCGEPTAEELAVWFQRMPTPAGWHLMSQELTNRPCGLTESCPQAKRVYQAAADGSFQDAATQMMETAGLSTRRVPRRGGCWEELIGCEVQGWRVGPADVVIDAAIVEVDDGNITISVRVRPRVGPIPTCDLLK